MKNLISLFCLSLLFSTIISVNAQEPIESFNDHAELQLSNTTTIPGFDEKADKLKISGIIYESDGVTPAKDVILYIEQADEHGDFDLRKEDGKRYVHNRGWIKTDADGRYTFYTYVPGYDRRYKLLQQLFPIVKTPSEDAYQIASFLFDEDPLLTKLCRKRINKKGDPTRILKLKKEDQFFVAEKDIVLSNHQIATR